MPWLGKRKRSICLDWETGRGRNKKAKLEGRGSCQPLESELEQLPSIFAVLRPGHGGGRVPAFRDRIPMTLPHQLLGNTPI